jgi:glycerophosphoryl diester phosphodiesterase
MLLRVSEILAPVVNQVVIISYDYSLINQFRETNWPQVGVVLEQWSDVENPSVLNCRPNYIFSDYRIIPRDARLETIKLFQQGMLAVYEVGTVELAMSLLARGVDMIETFSINDF